MSKRIFHLLGLVLLGWMQVLAQSDGFDPTPPGNPGANYWYSDRGEVVVDDFTPGRLESAINTVIGDADPKDVASIIVAGIMTNGDFSAFRRYTACALLDLSRVTGVTTVPNYAFNETKLETVYLPATIEKIGNYAFSKCDNLKTMSVYALTPPTLGNNSFYQVSKGLVVYVPAASLQLYMAAEGWKDFTILPIQKDIRSLTIVLPQGANVKDYEGMWLELENTKNGQKMHYVMTDRRQYTFPNIIYNTTWNVTLRNERGDVFGRIDNVEIGEENVSVTFAELSKPQDVTLRVTTPDGTDVTSLVQISWTDAAGNYLSQNATVSGLPEGAKITYRVTLPQDLAMTYLTPEATTVSVSSQLSTLNRQLSTIPSGRLTGTVTDATTSLPLYGATLTATQVFATYTKTVTTITAADGTYALDLSDVPTSVTIAADGYLSQTKENCPLSVVNCQLLPLTGAVIALNFTYTPCTEPGERSAEAEDLYSNFQNINYTVYNETQNRSIPFQVQYPQMVLMEDVADGDVLRLTATSRNDGFMPVEATATIANQQGRVTFDIIELGKIAATFHRTANSAVTGTLYNSTGQLVATQNYTNAKLTFEGLKDGDYTLLTMGTSVLFNTIGSLDGLATTNLTEGADYVLNQVSVSSGITSSVTIDDVPKLDESKLYYTGEGTSFTANKPEIVAGNYLTLTGRLDFKPEYAEGVSQVQLIADIPEKCQFVENSVMVGNNVAPYTLNGHRLTIPIDNYEERVRFCIVPTTGGSYTPNAFVQFGLHGGTITQPIGSATFSAQNLSLSAPRTTKSETITVNGMAFGMSKVNIYDGSVLIGQTTSQGDGSWMATCPLNNPVNLSHHHITAKLTTTDGIELTSETVTCVYNVNAIQVSKVKMYHYGQEITFDYQNPSKKTEKYTVAQYDRKFTFTIEFTKNDPELVSDVELWVKNSKNEWFPLEASFDEKKRLWVAAGEFKNNDLPVNVGVEFLDNSELKADVSQLRSVFTDTSDYDDMKDYYQRVDAFVSQFKGSQEDLEVFGQLCEEILSPADLQEVRDFETSLVQKTDDEINAMMDEVLASDILEGYEDIDEATDYDRYYNYTIDGYTYIYRSCDGLTLADVPAGSQAITDLDGTTVYVYQSRDRLCYIDFTQNTWFEVSYQKPANGSPAMNRAGDDDTKKIIKDWEQTLMDHDLIVKAGQELRKQSSELGKEIAKQKKLASKCKDAIKYKKYMDNIAAMTAKSAKYLKAAKRMAKLAKLTKGAPLLDLVLNAWECWDKHSELDEVFKGKEACKDSLLIGNIEWLAIDYADSLKTRTKQYYTSSFIGNTIIGTIAVAAAIACPLSLFASVPIIVGTNLVADHMYDSYFEKKKKYAENQYRKLMRKCLADQFEKWVKTGRYTGGNPFPGSDKKYYIDPAGFVYEAVESNRLEGVTATIFYKEMIEDMYGEWKENIVKWDASEYGQENPLFTDAEGNYRWDVPQGLWQVTFEKQGYETTCSEWLPVPPPQLDINIGMRQNVQPQVRDAHAYQDAIVVVFDKYMKAGLLTGENIRVTDATGEKVKAGTIQLVDEEDGMATKVRFQAAVPFDTEDLLLTVSNRVMSYAGVRMQDDYQQSFSVGEGRGGEIELTQIVCDSVVYVGYGDPGLMTVTVLPAKGAEGRVLHAKTNAPAIVGIETQDILLDENGSAQIAVYGNLPGTATISFTVDDSDLKGSTIVEVEELFFKTVAAPTSNIASGVFVDKGTEIRLSCTTEDAVIYYTLDGSCPCDDTPARKVYDGNPIVINEATTILAMAAAKGIGESSVVEFTYFVGDPSDIRIFDNGKLAIDNASTVRYNLQGQRVDKSYKGIVIRNGKTIINNY